MNLTASVRINAFGETEILTGLGWIVSKSRSSRFVRIRAAAQRIIFHKKCRTMSNLSAAFIQAGDEAEKIAFRCMVAGGAADGHARGEVASR